MGVISYTILTDLKLVHFQGSGTIYIEDIIAGIQSLHQHPDWCFEFNTFVDFEQATVTVDRQGLANYQVFFNKLQAETSPRRWAVYTREDSTHKAANMALLLESQRIAVDIFQHRDQALRFLGVDPQEFDARIA